LVPVAGVFLFCAEEGFGIPHSFIVPGFVLASALAVVVFAVGVKQLRIYRFEGRRLPKLENFYWPERMKIGFHLLLRFRQESLAFIILGTICGSLYLFFYGYIIYEIFFAAVREMESSTVRMVIIFTMLSGLFLTAARRWLKPDANQVMAADPRPPVLILRSFEDDEALDPLQESYANYNSAGVIAQIAESFSSFGPLVGFKRPQVSLPNDGIALITGHDDTWQEEFQALIDRAALIVVFVGTSAGLQWEVKQLVNGRHLGKTVFLSPPFNRSVRKENWEQFGKLQQEESALRRLHELPLGTILMVRWNDSGEMLAVDDGASNKYASVLTFCISMSTKPHSRLTR
jgi:hypothetical protein